MNKSYKSVWNETTGTYVAASETAKSRGKSSRSQKALVAALLAAGVGFGTAVKSEAAATPNSYAAGVLGTDSSNSDCISSADGAQVSTGADCTSGSAAQEAGIVSYDANGNAGAYFTVTDPNTAHVGVGGVDQLLVTNNGLFVLNALDMGSNKITNLAAGTAATDAANFGQVTATAQSIAAALGGGASVDASGRVTTPTYTIGGLSYSDVGSALGGLDARMTSDETAIDNLAVSGSKYIAVGTGGNSASATGAGSLAIGPNAKAPGNNAQAFGSNSYVSGQNSIGMGYNSTVSAAQSTALGYASNVGSSAAGSTALGWYATSTAASGVAVGGGAAATAANSVALGASSLANRANTVSVGTAGATRQIVNVGAATQATDAVNYAQLQAAGLKTDSSGNATNSFVAYDDTTEGKVTLGGSAGTTLTNVAAGAVTSSSTDAVNGSQLYANAASTAAALGGGSTVNADGTVSAPSYSVGGTTVNNVGAAITNIDGRVTQNTSDIASLQTAVGTMSGSVANAVSYDSSAHNQVTLGGSSGAPAVKLTNLQEGELSATSTDAVTGAQLWNTNQQLSDLTQSVQNQQQTGSSSISVNTGSQPAAAATGNNAVAVGGGAQASGDNSVAIGSGSVADVANTVSVGSQGNERRITNVANGTAPTDAVNLGQMQSAIGDTARAAYSGVAAATALTMIPEVDPGKTLAVGVAGGTYKGYQAAAVGASARITQNLKIKIGAGVSGSETTVGAGASYQW